MAEDLVVEFCGEKAHHILNVGIPGAIKVGGKQAPRVVVEHHEPGIGESGLFQRLCSRQILVPLRELLSQDAPLARLDLEENAQFAPHAALLALSLRRRLGCSGHRLASLCDVTKSYIRCGFVAFDTGAVSHTGQIAIALPFVHPPKTSARFFGSLRSWWFNWWRRMEDWR